MKKFIAHLKSVGTLSMSRPHVTPKLEKENDGDYEQRTWRNRLHTDEDDTVFIPPMMFKNCLDNAAKYLSKKIPGGRNRTYTKHFEAGVLVVDPLILPLKKKEVDSETLFMSASGQRGPGTRVWRTYPKINSWEGKVEFLILDETITLLVFKEHLIAAGQFVGIGRFAPRNRGYYGRFLVVDALEVEA